MENIKSTRFLMIVLATVIGSAYIFTYHQLYSQEHIVSLETAVKYVHNFRSNPSVSNIQGGSLSRDAFDKILAQSGCIGIRFYYAKKDNGDHTMVFLGVDEKGNDMQNGVIAEEIRPCPPICDSQNSVFK
jgi:hypothetical protein